MKEIAVYGSGGMGRDVLMLINQINKITPTWKFIGWYDDNYTKGEIVFGYEVLGNRDDLRNLRKNINLSIGIGDSRNRKNIVNFIKNEFINFPILVDPAVELNDFQNIEIGSGSIITAGCIITTNVKIGEHCLINTRSTIGHDVVMGDFCSLMPSVVISGECVINEQVYIGTGSTLVNQIEIGEKSIIGAGACVVKDIPSSSLAFGVPARVIRTIK